MRRTEPGKCLVFFALLFTGIAQADFLEDPLKQGWHWYPPEKSESEIPKEKTSKKTAKADPLERIQGIRQELERRKAQAVLEPTEKNILSYLTYQNEQVLERAGAFADQFRRVGWAHPELDHHIQPPINNLGKRVWLEQRQASEKNAVQELGKHYGLFFFFRSDCPYCHQFAPILQDFAKRNGLTVIPVSLDGGGLPEYPNPQRNNGQFERLTGKQAVVPAVLAVNPQTQKVVLISYGLVAQDELQQRIYVLTQTEVGHDF